MINMMLLTLCIFFVLPPKIVISQEAINETTIPPNTITDVTTNSLSPTIPTSEHEIRQIQCLFGGRGGGPPIPGNPGPVPVDINTTFKYTNSTVIINPGVSDVNGTLPDVLPGVPGGKGTMPIAPSGPSPPTFPKGITLKDLCNKCNITNKECLCSLQTILCAVVNETNKPKNQTSSTKILLCFDDYDKINASFNVIFGAIGFIGNFVVVLITIAFRKSFSRCQKLIGGLSGFDMIFCAVQIVLFIPRFWTCSWLYGLPMCKVLNSCTNLSSFVSLGFIAIIAIERYVGIVHPFNRSLTRSVISFMVFVNFAIAIGLAFPKIIFLQLIKFDNDMSYCTEKWPSRASSKVYTWFLFIGYFLIPIITIIILYLKIIRTLRDSVNTQMSAVDENQFKKRLLNNRRVMNIFLGILIAFIVLVLPNRMYWLIKDHTDIGADSNKKLVLFGFIPFSIHSAINPLLYSIIDRRFRKHVLRSLCCKFGEEKLKPFTEITGISGTETSIHLKSVKR